MIGYAQNSLVTAAPRVLNDGIPRQILGLFRRRGRGGGGSRRLIIGGGAGVAADEVHLRGREIVQRVGARPTRAEEGP